MALDPRSASARPEYRERRTFLLEVRDLAGWRLKFYGLTASGADLSPSVFDASSSFVAARLVEDELLLSPPPLEPYGFVVIHEGLEGVWLLLCLWNEDILVHHLYRAEHDAPTVFRSAMDHGAGVCVWELEVLKHERDAWVKHVLARPVSGDHQAYLRDVLSIAGGTS